MTKTQAINWAILEVENRFHEEKRSLNNFQASRDEYQFNENPKMAESLACGITLCRRNMQRCNEVLTHLTELKDLIRQGGINV
jgi:hypothetical protein